MSIQPPDDQPQPAVPYCPFRCPRCDATKPRTYKVVGRLRYHRCQSCDTRYRSVEVGPGEIDGWHRARQQLVDLAPPPLAARPPTAPRAGRQGARASAAGRAGQAASEGADARRLLPLVPYCPFRCPRCKEAKPRTYKVVGRLRYHRCKQCGTKFRSIETRPAGHVPPASLGAPVPARPHRLVAHQGGTAPATPSRLAAQRSTPGSDRAPVRARRLSQ